MARPKTNIIKTVRPPQTFKGALFARLYQYGKVEVIGLGVFSLVEIPDRKTFHNFSGKTRVFKGYTRLKFTQSPALKDYLSRHDTN